MDQKEKEELERNVQSVYSEKAVEYNELSDDLKQVSGGFGIVDSRRKLIVKRSRKPLEDCSHNN